MLNAASLDTPKVTSKHISSALSRGEAHLMQIIVELLSLLLLLLMNIAHILLFLSRLFDLFKLILLIPLELCDLLHQLLLLSEYLIPLYLYPI